MITSAVYLNRLELLHPKLKLVVEDVAKRLDLAVICTYRNRADQELAYRSGNSRVRFGASAHNYDPSYAVDLALLVGKKIRWDTLSDFFKVYNEMWMSAHKLGVEIEWGGNWKSFKDYPHYQLKNWKELAGLIKKPDAKK